MIPPTISAASAAAATWDVVVIGAGPSGALAARQVALEGARTLLVDQCAFPRSKVCGACVNPNALSLLESVGLGTRVGRLGGVPLRWCQLQSRGRTVRLPLAGGMAVSRSRLDAALVEAACQAGALFLPATNAAVLPAESKPRPGFRQVRLSSGGRPAQITRSRIVLAADGLGHPSLRQAGEFRPRIAAHSRIGLGATIHEFADSYARNTIYMAVGTGGYVGLVRIEDGSLNVAAAVDPKYLNQNGGPAEAVTAILHEAGFPNIGTLSSAAWRGTRPLTQVTDPPAGSRVFLVGDAAGYVEPFTGEGIAWALASAAAVVPLVLEGIARWDPRLAAQWRALHRRRIVQRQWICRVATAGLRHPALVRGLIGTLSISPTLGGLLIRPISGMPTC